jgi:small-conductance mechanosensitive channel
VKTPTPAQILAPIEKVSALVQPEPALLIVVLAIVAVLIYRIFLRGLTPERHRLLRGLQKNMAIHLVAMVALFSAYSALFAAGPEAGGTSLKVANYIGILTIVWGALVFVKTARILLFEYLFFGHMREGVPVLLVNLFTLMLSMVVGGWIVSEVFSVRIGPLLATSAIFSIVLGLALQDTLGNLFAGVALQLDKPYEIGDWIEVQNGPMKWIGQVTEINWRATMLVGMTDESITIPNRVISQSQVANFSTRSRPFCRASLFRLPYGADIEKARTILLTACENVDGIVSAPAPLTLVAECAESWITLRLVYFLEDYGSQFTIADRVATKALAGFAAAGITLATPRLNITQKS